MPLRRVTVIGVAHARFQNDHAEKPQMNVFKFILSDVFWFRIDGHDSVQNDQVKMKAHRTLSKPPVISPSLFWNQLKS